MKNNFSGFSGLVIFDICETTPIEFYLKGMNNMMNSFSR